MEIAWTIAGGGARLARALAAAGLLGLVAACAGGGGAPTAIYDLSARATPGEGRARLSTQILVPEPRALQALNTNSIAVRPSPQTLSYYGKVTWSDTLPKLLQARVVQSFEDSGRVRAVGLPGQGLLINYQLPIEVRAFELRSDGRPRAFIEIAAKVVNDANGKVLGTRVFTAEAPARSDEVGAAVAALDVALKQVLDELVRWTLATI
jgi:cholesterol transport system auxiliary component